MGIAEATLLTKSAIDAWQPRHLILGGIAGGFPGRDRYLGDILIADQVIAYEAAKIRGDKVDRRYEAYRSSQSLVEAARKVASAPFSWLARIHAERPDGSSGRTNPVVHFGTVLSGDKVVASDTFLRDFRDVWTTTVGVEMEGAGAALATFRSERPPEFLMVKGICDWADESKNDEWQPYAAEAAATFVVDLLAKVVPAAAPIRHAETRAPNSPQCTATERMEICDRLHDSWKEIADFFETDTRTRERFESGRQMQELWNWLTKRKRLGSLPTALEFVGRKDVLDDYPCLQTAKKAT
jgi:nucleoside phosphorylase